MSLSLWYLPFPDTLNCLFCCTTGCSDYQTTSCAASHILVRWDWYYCPVLHWWRSYFPFLEISNRDFLRSDVVCLILQAFSPRSIVHGILVKKHLLGGKAFHRYDVTLDLQRKTYFVPLSICLPPFQQVACIVVERTLCSIEKGQNQAGDCIVCWMPVSRNSASVGNRSLTCTERRQ